MEVFLVRCIFLNGCTLLAAAVKVILTASRDTGRSLTLPASALVEINGTGKVLFVS